MSRSAAVRLLLVACLVPAVFTACNRDPNVKKQKFLESGNRYRDQGKFREAAIQYANAVQVDPRFAEAHYQLGEVYLKLGDPQRAFDQFRSIVDKMPENYPANLEIANLLISSRQLKEAQPHLDILREKQPDSPDTHIAWAHFDAAKDEMASALQEMQKAIAADPSRSDSYLNLALLQDRANLPDQAEISLKTAIKLAPKVMNYRLALGEFYQNRHRMPEAEEELKHAIDIDPKDPTPRVYYSGLLMAEDKKAEAETFLKQAKGDFPDNSEGYSMLAVFYATTGDFDKALAEYASLHSEHPKDMQVKKNYIEALIRKGRLDEAAKLNDEILKTSPKDPFALIYRGQVQIGRGDAAGAVDSLQQALKNDPNSAVAHYFLAQAFDMQHNEAQAESEEREAVRLRPDYTDAQKALALLELARGDLDGLSETARQLIEYAPNSPDGYAYRARVEAGQKKYADAEHDMRKAAELAPKSALPYLQLGNLLLMQKQYSEAMKSFAQALDREPSTAEGLEGLMKVYLSQKQPDQAIAAAKAQIAKSPDSSGFYDLLGTALFYSKKDFGGADAAFRKAVELDRNNSDALFKLAQVEVAEGSPSEALATDLQSIKDHPREIQFYLLAGMMYESQSQFDQAKSMYQQALNIQSDNALASNNLAYLMLQQGGNVDVAMSMAQTARRGMPDSPAAADTLGYAYFQKGVYQSAIDMFQEALRLNEKKGAADDPNVHYHLGLAYEKVNQTAQARQQLERALKISPNFNDARKALSELHG